MEESSGPEISPFRYAPEIPYTPHSYILFLSENIFSGILVVGNDDHSRKHNAPARSVSSRLAKRPKREYCSERCTHDVIRELVTLMQSEC